MKRSIVKALYGIGVIVSITPIVHSAHAQHSPNVVLQIQNMQQEIAQLRDMVERQNYQIRQLQRQVAANGGSAANPVLAPSALESRNAPLEASSNQGAQGIYGTGQAASTYSTGSVSPNPAVPTQPYPNTQTAVQQSAAPAQAAVQGVGNAAVVTAQTSQQPVVASTSNYPPVDEVNLSGARPANNVSSSQAVPENAPVVDRSISGDASALIPATPSTAPIASSQQQPSYNAGAVNGVDNTSRVVTNVPSSSSSSAGGIIPVPPVANTSANVQAQPALQARFSEQDYYQKGFALLKESKHDEARKIFSQQLSDYPSGELADDAHYWVAESHYVNRELDQSKTSFRTIIDRFKQSPRLPDAMLKTAYIEQEQGNVIEARILLQEVVQYHPRSNAAISAKNRLAELK